YRICDPGETRSPDQQLRRLLLYPLSYGAIKKRLTPHERVPRRRSPSALLDARDLERVRERRGDVVARHADGRTTRRERVEQVRPAGTDQARQPDRIRAARRQPSASRRRLLPWQP